MARTRNRQMKQAEAFVQASPKKIWKAGIYTRISVDINGEKRESLETQKLMLFPKSRFLRLHSVIFVPSQIRESKPVIAFQRE